MKTNAGSLPLRHRHFKYDWRKDGLWNLTFALGVMVGGFVGVALLPAHHVVAILARTRAELAALGLHDFSGLAPRELFSWSSLLTLRGIVALITKAEVISWFRIQEMFRFESFHMYGMILTAILVAGTSIEVLKRWAVGALSSAPIMIPPKTMGRAIGIGSGALRAGLGAHRRLSRAALRSPSFAAPPLRQSLRRIMPRRAPRPSRDDEAATTRLLLVF